MWDSRQGYPMSSSRASFNEAHEGALNEREIANV